MQIECLNCHEHFEVPEGELALEAGDPRFVGLTPEQRVELLRSQNANAVQLVQGCVDSEGTWQVRGGLDLEIVYHECPDGFFTTPPNVQRLIRREGED